MNTEIGGFINSFISPDRKFGEIPFYWWSGDKLNKERLTSQLEALAKNGVAGVQINYAHINKGGEEDLQYGGHGKTLPGDPIQFSEEWWDFFSHAAKECERLGMGIGVGDYTIAWIGNGFFTDKLASMPGMTAKNLKCEKRMLYTGDESSLGEDVIVAVTYPDPGCNLPNILYTAEKGFEEPLPPCCECYIVTAQYTPLSIDPLAPDCGKILTDIYFKEFERRLPLLKKGTLNYFFQDELLFGCDIKTLWRDSLRDGVKEKYGYDILGFLPHLFFELGDITAKIRLDVADIKTELIERNYFRPIYDFHASRGMIYGCDQSGRGTDPGEFSDYFRTVRWFTAPGNDTPGRAAHLIKVKVNSSIAHLYDRPRVWLEGYHSSGWGTTLESITAPTSDNFLFGANLLNLHGLYYSTNGGFFEWAPPDFHFRMPYWDDEKQWLMKYKRLAALLTQGVHRCDAAVYYPVSSCDLGVNAEQCVGTTFAVAEYLFENGIDFDFIDFQSIERAVCEDHTLNVAGESYKVLLFCGVDCVRYSAIIKAKEMLDCGGTVIFYGITPYASERAGARDAVLNDDIKSLLSHPNCRLIINELDLIGFMNSNITRSFLPEYITDKVYATKRVCDNDSLYFVRYAPKNSVCRFEAENTPYLLDTYTGETAKLTGTVCKNGFTFIKMPNEADEDTVILFSDGVEYDREINTSGFSVPETVRITELDGDWEFTLEPTLDNKYGDFYLPSGGMIGAQARFFDCTPVKSDTEIPENFRYEAMPYCTSTAIKRIKPCGDIHNLCKFLAGNAKAAASDSFTFDGVEYLFEIQPLHGRYGYICTEGGDTRIFEQGQHGLKGRVFDDNMHFRENSVFVTNVYSEGMQTSIIKCGMQPDILFINGIRADKAETVELKKGKNLVVAGFVYDKDKCPNYRNRGEIKRGGIAFAKCAVPKKTDIPLAVSYFANSDFLKLVSADENDIFCYRFMTVPGFVGFKANVFGEILRAQNNGEQMKIKYSGAGNFGGDMFTVTASPTAKISECIFFVKTRKGYEYTEALPEPLDIISQTGQIRCTDTSKTGALVCYSGKMIYKKIVTLEKINIDERFTLDIGDAGTTVKAEINGKTAAVFTYRPFKADITDFVKNGVNEIKLTVSNTLCNHYSTVPSYYSNFPTDAKSGLIGPVTVKVTKTT